MTRRLEETLGKAHACARTIFHDEELFVFDDFVNQLVSSTALEEDVEVCLNAPRTNNSKPSSSSSSSSCSSCKRKNLRDADFDPDRKTCRACLRTQRRRHALKVRAELKRRAARGGASVEKVVVV